MDIPTGHIIVIPVRVIIIFVLTRVTRRLAKKKKNYINFLPIR
jgi:hypothetical protein